MEIANAFEFSEKASFPKNAVALIYDLEGFSRFFNQPDVQDYVPAFLNHVSKAVGVCLFGGSAYWSGEKSLSVLKVHVAHEKFLGDGALYILLPPDGESDFSPKTLSLLCNRLWNLKKDFDLVVKQALDDVPVFEVPKRIRFGLSRGSVYELHRPKGGLPEFIGFCINQASRLQSYCPDLGFIASARLRIPAAELEKHGYCKVVAKDVKGFPDEVVVLDSGEYDDLEPAVREKLFKSV